MIGTIKYVSQIAKPQKSRESICSLQSFEMLPQAFAISLDRIQITMKELPKDKEKIKSGKKIYNSN